MGVVLGRVRAHDHTVPVGQRSGQGHERGAQPVEHPGPQVEVAGEALALGGIGVVAGHLAEPAGALGAVGADDVGEVRRHEHEAPDVGADLVDALAVQAVHLGPPQVDPGVAGDDHPVGQRRLVGPDDLGLGLAPAAERAGLGQGLGGEAPLHVGGRAALVDEALLVDGGVGVAQRPDVAHLPQGQRLDALVEVEPPGKVAHAAVELGLLPDDDLPAPRRPRARRAAGVLRARVP